jgi:hypothetical protein
MKYKKGDKVKVLYSDWTLVKEGEEHTISKVNERFVYIYKNGTNWCFNLNEIELIKEPKVSKYKIGDNVKYKGYKGVIVAIGTDGMFAVKFKGFDGHSCSWDISEGSVESIDFDGWWCDSKNLKLIKKPKVMKYKIGDKVRVTRQTNEHSFNVGDVVECISSRVTVIGKLKCFKFSNGTKEQLLDEIDFEKYKEPKLKDSIVKEVRQDLKDRSKGGIKKYGVTLDRKDLDLLDWLTHSYEEVLDTALYLKRAIKELKTNKK